MPTATQVRERPVIFSGPMVKAILAGRKTQTRRVLKQQPERYDDRMIWCPPGARYVAVADCWVPSCVWNPDLPVMETGAAGIVQFCPYGVPGDRLWVRETFIVGYDTDDYGDLITTDSEGNDLPEKVWYRATDDDFHWTDEDGSPAERIPWKPSIHMPRWASRLTLEIEAVKVERLAKISSEDAIAEGFEGYGAFLDAFYQINKGRITYADDPFVWAIGFKVIDKK